MFYPSQWREEAPHLAASKIEQRLRCVDLRGGVACGIQLRLLSGGPSAHETCTHCCLCLRRGVLPLRYRNQFGASPPPHALLLLSALLESVLAMRIKQTKRGRGRGKRGRKRTRKRKRKRNLRLEKDLLPTRSSLIQAGSSGSKCFTHPSGGKKLPILPQARSSSGCAALPCVAALHAEFNFVF